MLFRLYIVYLLIQDYYLKGNYIKKLITFPIALILSSNITPSVVTIEKVSAQEDVGSLNSEVNYNANSILSGDKENVEITVINEYSYITNFEQNNEKYILQENMSKDLSTINTKVFHDNNGSKEKIGEMLSINEVDTDNNSINHKQYIDGQLVLQETIDLSGEVTEEETIVVSEGDSYLESSLNDSTMRTSAVKYEWRSYPRERGSNRIQRSTVAGVTALLVFIAGSGIGTLAGSSFFGGAVGAYVGAAAADYISSGWPVVYQDKYLQTRHQHNGITWNMVGAQLQTRFFSNSDYSGFVDSVITTN